MTALYRQQVESSRREVMWRVEHARVQQQARVAAEKEAAAKQATKYGARGGLARVPLTHSSCTDSSTHDRGRAKGKRKSKPKAGAAAAVQQAGDVAAAAAVEGMTAPSLVSADAMPWLRAVLMLVGMLTTSPSSPLGEPRDGVSGPCADVEFLQHHHFVITTCVKELRAYSMRIHNNAPQQTVRLHPSPLPSPAFAH